MAEKNAQGSLGPYGLAQCLCVLAALLLASRVEAAEWSSTELHLQAGRLDVPSFAGGGSADHLIYTLQHASRWKHGNLFFFLDVQDSRESGFQDFDAYGEAYANLSVGKISGKPMTFGPVSDVGLIGGVNWSADSNVRKYAAGVRLALDLPGFAFANLDVMALMDDSGGIASGGAPRPGRHRRRRFQFRTTIPDRRSGLQHRGTHRVRWQTDQRTRREGRVLDPRAAPVAMACERTDLSRH